MSEVNYVENWPDVSTQCQNCKSFQTQDNKNACVPDKMSFEEALRQFGECSLEGHCDYFEAK